MPPLRWAVVPVLVLPVARLWMQGIGRDPRALPSPLIGRPMPAFELIGIDGQPVDSDDLRGKPVIVNFWASWYIECIAERQVLLGAQQRYGSELAIVGLLYQDRPQDQHRPQDALPFLARHGDGGWPVLIDADGRVAIDYGVTDVPESFFVDPSRPASAAAAASSRMLLLRLPVPRGQIDQVGAQARVEVAESLGELPQGQASVSRQQLIDGAARRLLHRLGLGHRRAVAVQAPDLAPLQKALLVEPPENGQHGRVRQRLAALASEPFCGLRHRQLALAPQQPQCGAGE
jgi:cytochrome c biogenesis protein CcmG/thiol:disulfide interchange protein DsbE